MSDDRAGPRVAAVLEGLQNACGALEVQGHPGGVIYLDKGHITYAQSDWSPDLTARLLGTLRSAAGLRGLMAAADQPGGNLGALLIEHGHVSADELTALLHSVIVDAVIALTVPLIHGASVAGLRLLSGRVHWASAFIRLPIGAVRAEAMSRAEHMAACPVSFTTRLELCDLTGGPAVLTGQQWALASEMSSAFSARDLAWAAGFSLYETVGCVGDLVQAGLCAPCQLGESAADLGTSRPSFDLDVVSESSASPTRRAASRPRTPPSAVGSSPGARPMPRRKPDEAAPVAQANGNPRAEANGRAQANGHAEANGQAHANGQARANGRAQANGQTDVAALLVKTEFTPVPIESLRRVLEGLRRLS